MYLSIADVTANGISLVAGGALLLEVGTDSMMAECQALELAVLSLKRLSQEMVVVCPHRYDRRLSTAELSREVLHEVVGD